ncbi:MAG: hypothetical protein ABIN20_07540 [candidate division WOR-3 bacterium]
MYASFFKIPLIVDGVKIFPFLVLNPSSFNKIEIFLVPYPSRKYLKIFLTIRDSFSSIS